MYNVNVNFEDVQLLILEVKTQNRQLNVLSVRQFVWFGFICFTLKNLDNMFDANYRKNRYFTTVFYK